MKFWRIKFIKKVESDEIVGVDGRIYRIVYDKPVILPDLNASVFVNGGAAEIIEILDEIDLFLIEEELESYDFEESIKEVLFQ